MILLVGKFVGQRQRLPWQ